MDRISTKGQMVEQIDLRNVPHSGFDRSNHNYQSCKLGKIVPARLDGMYPGDRVKGRPEIVANFEPLAGPVMGSMALKQESFFVPIYEVWRHAERFFTQKDESLITPSVSPLQIFQAYANYSLLGVLGYTGLGSTAPDSRFIFNNDAWNAFYNALAVCINGNALFDMGDDYDIDSIYSQLNSAAHWLEVFGEEYAVLDLLQPQIDRINKLLSLDFEGNLHELIGIVSNVDTDDYKSPALLICDMMERFYSDYYDYFFGPSSLLDYIGYPVIDDIDKFYHNVLDAVRVGQEIDDIQALLDITDSDDEYENSLISRIPLTFLPFRVYYLIWFWNYRDQLLEKQAYDCDTDEFTSDSVSNIQMVLFTLLRVRCWYKDTFTTALTNTGDGNLVVPTTDSIGLEAEFTYYDEDGNLINTTDKVAAFNSGAQICKISFGGLSYKVPMNYLVSSFQPSATSTNQSEFISLDLFDRIKRLRSFVQKRLILGYEVDDVVYSSFLVKMSNVRLRIPELLGRGRDAIQMNTIVNNTTTTEQIAGDKTATAWAQGTMSEINYFAEEWGFYMHLYTILPIQSYSGGMQRLWLKRDVFDYMWPEFATMGMDAVYNCELAAPGSRLSDEQSLLVFGYQGRYYDLKSRQDEVHGRLRTDLHYLTFSRDFDKNNPPKLNYIFVHCWPSLDMFVTDDPDVDVVRQVDIYHGIAFERRLPVPSEYVG